MKKFLLPLQHIVRADLFFRRRRICLWHDGFFGSLDARDFAFHFTRPLIPSRAQCDENKIPFKLSQEYTANWENANLKSAPQG